jgi:hypothetical protein
LDVKSATILVTEAICNTQLEGPQFFNKNFSVTLFFGSLRIIKMALADQTGFTGIFNVRQVNLKNSPIPSYDSMVYSIALFPHGADLPRPLPLSATKAGKNHLNG